MCYIYTMEYYSAVRKKWNTVIYNSIKGPWEYHAKWDKSDRES